MMLVAPCPPVSSPTVVPGTAVVCLPDSSILPTLPPDNEHISPDNSPHQTRSCMCATFVTSGESANAVAQMLPHLANTPSLWKLFLEIM